VAPIIFSGCRDDAFWQTIATIGPEVMNSTTSSKTVFPEYHNATLLVRGLPLRILSQPLGKSLHAMDNFTYESTLHTIRLNSLRMCRSKAYLQFIN